MFDCTQKARRMYIVSVLLIRSNVPSIWRACMHACIDMLLYIQGFATARRRNKIHTKVKGTIFSLSSVYEKNSLSLNIFRYSGHSQSCNRMSLMSVSFLKGRTPHLFTLRFTCSTTCNIKWRMSCTIVWYNILSWWYLTFNLRQSRFISLEHLRVSNILRNFDRIFWF